MGQHAVFARLGAPLPHRSAWGSVRQSDGVVFLAVWQDRIQRINGVLCGRITHHSKRNGGEPLADSWLREYEARLEHVELIRQGRRCFLIINRAKNTKVHTRTVDGVHSDEVFVGGALVEHGDETWIEVGAAIPIQEAARQIP